MRRWLPAGALALSGCMPSHGPEWFPGATVLLVVVGGLLCYAGWRKFISGQRHARRDDRQERREERRGDRGPGAA